MSEETKTSAPLTADRIDAIVRLAYRRCGYDVITWSDGSVGIVGTTARQLAVTNELKDLLAEEVGLEPKDERPIHIVDVRRKTSLCGIAKGEGGELHEGWPEGFRGTGSKPAWWVARADCPECLAAYAKRGGR